jgi:hypothetical protein
VEAVERGLVRQSVDVDSLYNTLPLLVGLHGRDHKETDHDSSRSAHESRKFSMMGASFSGSSNNSDNAPKR